MNFRFRRNYISILFDVLLNDSKYIDAVPVISNNLLNRARRHLGKHLYSSYGRYGCQGSRVETQRGSISIFTYVNRFTRSLFRCLRNCSKYEMGVFNAITDLPNRVYHGTSTKFLNLILKEGLLPSKYSQCWKEDKEQKSPMVYLTDSVYAAERFAIEASRRIGGEPIVIEVNIMRLKDKLNFRLEKSYNGHSTTLNIYMEIYSENPIHPTLISNLYMLPKIPVAALLEEMIRKSECVK